jgi:hypothetical protein
VLIDLQGKNREGLRLAHSLVSTGISLDLHRCVDYVLYTSRPSGVTSDSEVGTPMKYSDKCSGVTSDSEVTSPIKQ